MSVVITKSAKSLANGSFIAAAIVTLLAGLFLGLILLNGEIGTVLKIILGIVVFVCMIWAPILVRQGLAYRRSGRDERVEITDRKLSWQSPVQDIMRSFELPLSNIRTLRQVRTKRKSRSGPRFTDKFSIELHKGDTINLSTNASGIAFDKVFEAMREHGVPFELDVVKR